MAILRRFICEIEENRTIGILSGSTQVSKFHKLIYKIFKIYDSYRIKKMWDIIANARDQISQITLCAYYTVTIYVVIPL